MLFFLIVLLLLVFSGAKFCSANEFNKDYLSKFNTTAVNGIFVILVVFRHYNEYVSWHGFIDDPFITFNRLLGQLLVVTFLFYSGYGMMEQIKKKGFKYIEKIPTKWIHLIVKFDIAVFLYLILGLLIGKRFGIMQILFSFVGWETLGNSNWYIFVVLVLYILMIISFLILKKNDNTFNKYFASMILFALSMLLVLFLIKSGKASHWYNTILVFPVGVFYSLIKTKIEKVIMKNDITYLFFFGFFTLIFFITFKFRYSIEALTYNMWATSFMALVLLITMKVSIKNEWLVWLGKHIFSIYILQRLLMITLYHFGFTTNHRYICLMLVISGILLLASFYDKYIDKFIKFITMKINEKESVQQNIF